MYKPKPKRALSWIRRTKKNPRMTISAVDVYAPSSIEDLLKAEGFALVSSRQKAPDFTLDLLDGTERNLSGYEGKVVILNNPAAIYKTTIIR